MLSLWLFGNMSSIGLVDELGCIGDLLHVDRGADTALVASARIENDQNKFGCLAAFLAGFFRFYEGQGIPQLCGAV